MTKLGWIREQYATSGAEKRVSRFNPGYADWCRRADDWAQENNL